MTLDYRGRLVKTQPMPRVWPGSGKSSIDGRKTRQRVRLEKFFVPNDLPAFYPRSHRYRVGDGPLAIQEELLFSQPGPPLAWIAIISSSSNSAKEAGRIYPLRFHCSKTASANGS